MWVWISASFKTYKKNLKTKLNEKKKNPFSLWLDKTHRSQIATTSFYARGQRSWWHSQCGGCWGCHSDCTAAESHTWSISAPPVRRRDIKPNWSIHIINTILNTTQIVLRIIFLLFKQVKKHWEQLTDLTKMKQSVSTKQIQTATEEDYRMTINSN